MGRCSHQILKYRSMRGKIIHMKMQQSNIEPRESFKLEQKWRFVFATPFAFSFKHVGLTEMREQTNQFYKRVKVILIQDRQVYLDVWKNKNLLNKEDFALMGWSCMFVMTFSLRASNRSLSVNHCNGWWFVMCGSITTVSFSDHRITQTPRPPSNFYSPQTAGNEQRGFTRLLQRVWPQG